MNYNFSTLYRLYALELSNKKWFIYTTKETDTKNIDLNSKLLYQFVSNNLPILSHNSTKLNDVLEVNFYVKKYMRLYGIKNVRGGSYSDEILSSEIKDMLEKNLSAPAPPFSNYELLRPAIEFKNRHASIMLVLDATRNALQDD